MNYGNLRDYSTNDYIRPATQAELARSLQAASCDGGAGVIRVDARSVHVDGGNRIANRDGVSEVSEEEVEVEVEAFEIYDN